MAYPSVGQRETVAYCGTHSGADVDKFAETALKTAPADVVGAPLIADSVACFECVQRGTLETGDHTIFAGEIVAAPVSEHEEKLYNFGNFDDAGAESFRPISEPQ